MRNSEDKNGISEKEIQKNLNDFEYPINEDIYNQEVKAKKINPDNINTEKTIDQKEGQWNENSFNTSTENKLGDNLDVPGSELDDAQENIGSEDEENNYYSQSDN